MGAVQQNKPDYGEQKLNTAFAPNDNMLVGYVCNESDPENGLDNIEGTAARDGDPDGTAVEYVSAEGGGVEIEGGVGGGEYIYTGKNWGALYTIEAGTILVRLGQIDVDVDMSGENLWTEGHGINQDYGLNLRIGQSASEGGSFNFDFKHKPAGDTRKDLTIFDLFFGRHTIILVWDGTQYQAWANSHNIPFTGNLSGQSWGANNAVKFFGDPYIGYCSNGFNFELYAFAIWGEALGQADRNTLFNDPYYPFRDAVEGLKPATRISHLRARKLAAHDGLRGVKVR